MIENIEQLYATVTGSGAFTEKESRDIFQYLRSSNEAGEKYVIEQNIENNLKSVCALFVDMAEQDASNPEMRKAAEMYPSVTGSLFYALILTAIGILQKEGKLT